MPGERLSMRKIHEILRLRWESHLPLRAIARSLRLSQGTVSDYLVGRAASSELAPAGWGWTMPTSGRCCSRRRRMCRPTNARCRTGRRFTGISGGRT
jgi:hypothetical protein